MNIARQLMTNLIKPTLASSKAALLVLSALTAACNPTVLPSNGQRSFLSNASPELVNKAFIYRDGPAIVEGPKYGPAVDMRSSTDAASPEFITLNNELKSGCQISFFSGPKLIDECIRAYADNKAPLQTSLKKTGYGNWAYPINSPEFYLVNNMYHVQHGVRGFFDKLKFAYDTLHQTSQFYFTTKSIPLDLPQTKLSWFRGTSNDNYFRNDFLTTYALCSDLDLNAKYSPAGPDLCFGKWSKHPTFFFVQDPSVIYHELGHALISVMMNFRNGTLGGPTGVTYNALRSNLGGSGYDEAGSLGEGIADYFSFVMTKRTHIGEWALAKSVNASRPMSEDDPIHASGIDTVPEKRLSYPQYVLYDPNHPSVPFEDVHYAGQIASHYLVALTKQFQKECTAAKTHEKSTSYVMLLVAETLSELGDLNAVGVDLPVAPLNSVGQPLYFNNLDKLSSFTWAHVVNPPTFRRFFQVFSKNINKYMTNGLCTAFSNDLSEKLLDDYGLLLFQHYNDNGKSTKDKLVQYNNGFVGANNVPSLGVNPPNRRKTVLISKELLSLAVPSETKDVASYYIIDDKDSVKGILTNLLFKGIPINLSTDIADIKYNNDNIKVSPGEIVAIIPNLHNASNSTMAGVSILANDWDHVHITDLAGVNGNFKPCVVDDVTTAAQGAEAAATCAPTYPTFSSYNRHIKKPQSSGADRFSTEAVAPACLVQIEDGEVTKWVSQNEFRSKQGMELADKDCLGFSKTVAGVQDFTFNPHECLVRALPGANKAFFSKIDAQKSYIETMRTGNPDHVFGVGNAIMFEVNKWIPPGTKFRCRLRANFSNCTDCFNDPADTTNGDYIDAEYNGHKPFKIINLEFDVND